MARVLMLITGAVGQESWATISPVEQCFADVSNGLSALLSALLQIQRSCSCPM